MGSNLIINKEIEKYINEHSLELNPVQKEIISYNESLGDIKRMQIAVSQCQFLHLIIKTTKIMKILEIGTFTGLSALTMSLALPENGELVVLDKNEKTTKVAINFFKKAKQENKIKAIVKPALESLNDLKSQNKKFDLIFIDADKENYIKYYDLCFNLISNNGLILIDNVLWKGDVIDKNKNDRMTNIIRDFNTHIKNDDRIEKTILPIGDGITICRKV